MAFRFGHSQVHHEFRPWINGQISGFPGSPPARGHPFWLLNVAGFFQPPETFTTNENGKGWLNEVEGLINQKCPEADLQIQNVLTNELFSLYKDGSIAGRQGGISYEAEILIQTRVDYIRSKLGHML